MTRHQELVERLKVDGWLVGRWRETLEATLRDPRWWNDGDPVEADGWGDNECIVERVCEDDLRPDAYRFRVEGVAEGWGHDVLVVEIMEVWVTHHTSSEKWESLWFLFDASTCVHLRVFQMDRSGFVEPLMTEDNAIEQLYNRLQAAGDIRCAPRVKA